MQAIVPSEYRKVPEDLHTLLCPIDHHSDHQCETPPLQKNGHHSGSPHEMGRQQHYCSPVTTPPSSSEKGAL